LKTSRKREKSNGIFLSEVKALSIPQEAVPEQALEFLKKKIK
jgi:hypothetical protein